MNYNGLFVSKHPDVYEPSDDTFLLADVVANLTPPGRLVEVGCGAGLVAMTAAQAGFDVVATDLNPFAVELTRANAKQNGLTLDVRETDLLAGIDMADIVVFNPPYLPTADDDHVVGPLDLAFDGGLDGNKVALRFAKQVLELAPSQVLVVHSTLSDPVPLDNAMASYTLDIAATRRLAYEELTVRRYSR